MLEPQFFDIFGSMAFIFLITVAIWGLTGKKIPKIIYWFIFLIGLWGFIIDGTIVYQFYFK